MRMHAELTPTGRAILNFLRRDASTSSRMFHWDPSWITGELGLTSHEMYVACKPLESLGLVELCDLTTFAPELVLDDKLTDIRITARGLMGDFQFGRYPDAATDLDRE